MMFGIILVGTIFIFLDTSVPVMIGGTVAFGIILIMGLGLLTIEDFKRIPAFRTHRKDRNPAGPKGPKGPKDQKDQKDLKSAKSNRKSSQKSEEKGFFSGLRDRVRHTSAATASPAGNKSKTSAATDSSRDRAGIGAGLALAVGSLKSRLIRSKDSSHGQKIDELLDSAIYEPVGCTSQEIIRNTEERAEDDNSIADIFPGDPDDEDFGLLDDIEIDEDLCISDRIVPGEMTDTMDAAVNRGDRADDGMMSIEAILAGGTSAVANEEFLPGEPTTATPPEDLMESAYLEDFGEIDVDGGIISLDDDLAKNPFASPPGQSFAPDGEEEFSFGPEGDADPFGLDDSGAFSAQSFDTFDLDELDLDGEGSLDELGLDMVEDEEEEIDSAGLLPDDLLSDDRHRGEAPMGAKASGPKAEVLNFGGFGESSSEEFISFGGEDDDLLSMLKSDVQKRKTIQDISLLRDMKDTDVGVPELVEGLEEVLQKMAGTSSRQTKNHGREK